MSSSIDGASVVSEGPNTRKYRFKTSCLLLTASYLGLFGLIMVIISYASPYWLSSYKYTYSQFVRLGLWNFCFRNYKHPPYQYDETFNGCRWIYHPMYQNIRDWLQPGWFIFVQAMMTISMLMCIFALSSAAVPIMHFCLRYNVIFIGLAFILESLAALSGFLGWLVFFIQRDTRSWLLYPRFNHLDWAFYVAVISSGLNCASAVFFALEARKAYAKRQRFSNLVYNMHPRPSSNGFETIPLKAPPALPPVHSQRQYSSQQSQGSSRYQPEQLGSTHSSPYASISRYSQQQGPPTGQGYQSKSPPQPPPTRQSQFTAV